MSETATDEPPWTWCLVANVTREPHPEGPDGELRLGLKRFSPGTKVYVFPVFSGDGGERMRVLGRHRRGSKLIEIIIATKWLENWRVLKVYQPFVVQRMREYGAWGDTEAARRDAEEYLPSRVKPCEGEP